ncbi:MAG: ribosome recycling factor [Candidatus Hydrogenedens sp.]|nr:ribosome recycling factor [Candidatus Hydrogenedens sp.]
MIEEIMMEAEDKMHKCVEAFQGEMANIRTGRATAGMLDVVDVDVYGSRMKINQLGTINVSDAHMITIDLWDKSQMSVVEKAIVASPLGITPANDGRVIRLPIPPLSEERRKELVKVAGKHVEDAKVAIRNVRRHAVDQIKKLQKDGDLPEDDAHKRTDDVQKLTDKYTHDVDHAFAAKEKDIMEV